MRVLSSASLILVITIFLSTSLALIFSHQHGNSKNQVLAQLNTAITAELAKRETSLGNLVTAIESVEASRCARLQQWTLARDGCNVASCGNTFPASDGFQCLNGLGKDSDTCSATCDGLIRSEKKSTVLFAAGTSNDDKNIQGFLAIGKQIEVAQEIERNSSRATAWMGYGSVFGVSRWYPGSPRARSDTCNAYDPRLRPWYIAASSGPKDIVLVLDVSGSMITADCVTCKSRIDIQIDAASKLLDTLTFNDYFAIVTFNGANSGTIITANGAATLLQATDANKNAGKTALSGLIANGGTNFQTGFQKAFSIFASSTEATSGCARIIILATDGDAADGATIVSYIAGQQASLGAKKAFIQTITMGTDATMTIPRQIACANQGIHTNAGTGDNLLSAMASYYKFLATGVEATSTRPRWVEIYEDSFGMGLMTTASRPVYSSATGSPVFVGVAEVDVPIGVLTSLGTMDEVRYALSQRGKTCPTYNVTECQLQLLRNDAGYACPAPAATVSSCQAIVEEAANCSVGVVGGVNKMLCNSLNFGSMVSTSGAAPYEDVVCCDGCKKGLNAGAIVGIVIGSVVALVLVAVAIKFFFFAGVASTTVARTAGATEMGAVNVVAPPTIHTASVAPTLYPGLQPQQQPQQPQPDFNNANNTYNYNNNGNYPNGQYGNNNYPNFTGQPVYGQVQPNVAFGQVPPAGYGGNAV